MKKEKLTKMFQDRVVSSLTIYFVELDSRRLAVIEEVWTHPEFRRQGYSTELVKRAIKMAREYDANCIELTVRQDSPHIQEFYKSLGFYDRMQVAMRYDINQMKPWNP
jgi:ribosomal protein S18 acetylase RimI-like enzyme